MATTGQWGGLQVRFDIPEIRDAVDVVRSVFDIVITGLDLALNVLNIIKSFVSSLLNPVRAIIQELITALQNIILDFRQAGFYVNGDWYLLDDTTREQLRGGYAAYERRMITRLMDRADPGRPNFSPSDTVLALFLYAGADVSFVDRLADFSQLNVINQLIEGFGQFFGINITGSPLPIPSNLRASYSGGPVRTTPSTGGARSSPVADLRTSISRLEGRYGAVLQWNLSPSPGSDPTVPVPVIPPDGFLVEISVWPQGLYAGYLAPTPGSTGGVDGVPAEGSTATPSSYSTGLYQEADTGRPLQIFGGIDSVLIDPGVQWSDSFDSDGNLVEGATPAFFLTDLTSTRAIRTNVLQPPEGDTSGRYYNQRTLYVSHADVVAQSLVGGTYSLVLTKDDLPWQTPIAEDGTPNFDEATQPQTVYVRVLSCSNKVTSKDSFRWNLVPKTTPESVQIIPAEPVGTADRSGASQPIEVTFPTQETDSYIRALHTALAVMLLSRSDLVLPSESLDPSLADELASQTTYTPTGLETVARDLLPVLGIDPQDYFLSNAPPTSFGSDLLSKIGSMADFLIERQGNPPQPLLESLSSLFTRLTEWKWSDTTVSGARGLDTLNKTIIDSLTPNIEAGFLDPVVAKNASSLPDYATDPLRSVAMCRNLGVLDTYEASGFGAGISTMPDSSQAAPIVVAFMEGTSTSEIEVVAVPEGAWYARQLIPSEIYEDAAQVLSLVATESTVSGGWIAVRPFQSIGTISGPSDLTAQIQNFLESIAAGLQGGADLILNFISMLEQRVREIQEVIRRIESYLEIPLSIEIPDAVGLALVVNGIDGVVSGLVSSTNKPTDGPNAYAGGLVILGGGIPSIITDLILLLVNSA